ncbi:MAG: hypothetical protein IJZ72_07460 [Oscillospiraceae bacterium]|nr:hypothetical protein [Oscillospiraceae bacterium]
MKLTKIIGAVAAAALALSSLASIPASAADTYHAYIGVQTQNYAFRNAWNEPSYGLGVTGDDGMVYFDQITGWEGATALNKGGEFTDVEITGDGTYTVGVKNFDFGSDEYLNLLFVSTDIPLDCGATISDVKIKMDGSTVYTFDEAYLSPDEPSYLQPMAINIWNDDLGKQDGLFGYMMPSSSIEIEFTVSGLPAASAPAAETTEAPAADTAATTSATTGNAPIAVSVAVMAVAGAAAIASRKRK